MNKTCLIVGASGDIGITIAKRLANEGWSLVLHYYKNKDVLNQIPNSAIISIVQGDLRNAKGIQSFLNNLHCTVNAIVFASGTASYGLFQDMTDQAMEELFYLHVKSLWMITQQAIPGMIKEKTGNLIVISSIWGKKGASCEVIYSSVKGAQNSFVKALAKELGPSGIRVNGVSPGFIISKMNDVISNEEKQQITEEIPLGRLGKPEEVAHVVSFLLDEKSTYIQGEIIDVTGGWD